MTSDRTAAGDEPLPTAAPTSTTESGSAESAGPTGAASGTLSAGPGSQQDPSTRGAARKSKAQKAPPEKAAPAQGTEPRPVSPPGPTSDRYLGCTIDNRYKVEGIIGEGGMGVVYQCRHKIIDKRVALKILRPDVAKEPEVTERFLMEAKAASAIHDEHIINISDFGQLPDGAAYFVMEFLEGTPLSELAGGGNSIPVPRLLAIALQLAEGLSAAHQRGIVHRDLKPDNVFLIKRGKQSDFVKILDFGIAKVNKNTNNRLTQAGSVFGTPHYMSPEQAAGAPLDHRSDVYSLGIMLYELSTGNVPFDAENFVGILSQQLYEDPVPPRQTPGGDELPEHLEKVILKCLAKAADKRFQSMLELRDELLKLQKLCVPDLVVSSSREPLSAEAASVQGAVLSARSQRHPLGARRWPMYVAIAAPMAVVLFFFGAQMGANRAHRAERAASLAQAQADLSQKTRNVLVGVAPTAAHVLVEGIDQGLSPVSVAVPIGETVAVEVTLPGYLPRHLILDGSQARQSIELVRVNSPEPTRRVRVPTPPSSKPNPATKKQPRRRTRKKAVSSGSAVVKPWQD